MARIEDIIGMKEFVTLPAIATKVLKLLENDDVDINQLSGLIEADPSLSLKLLKLANSPLYGIKSEINSVKQAILIIGLNKLTNMVLGVSIFSKFWLTSQKGASDLINKFWIHSTSTAAVAKMLTNEIKVDLKENEFIGGLLYPIGKLALIQFNVDSYMKVIDLVQNKNKTDIEAENEIFELDHIEVGKEVSKLWKLPDELQNVITNYNSSETDDPLPLVVNFSSNFCEIKGAGFFKGITEADYLDNWIKIKNKFPKLDEYQKDEVENDLVGAFNEASDFMKTLSS